MSLWLGYDSSASFRVTGVTFPPGAQFRAAVRTHQGVLVAELSTAAGTIDLPAEDTVRLKFAGATTRAWATHAVIADVVRIDVDPHTHLGFKARLSFERPETRTWEP